MKSGLKAALVTIAIGVICFFPWQTSDSQEACCGAYPAVATASLASVEPAPCCPAAAARLASLGVGAAGALADEPPATAKYFGLEPPGMTPKIFAPDVVSLTNRFEQQCCFSPDGEEFCFTVTDAGWTSSTVYHTQWTGDQWTTPAPIRFIGSTYQTSFGFFAPDGECFYFVAPRPSFPPSDIWSCRRTADGWSTTAEVGPPVSSSSNEWSFSVVNSGTIYLCSHRPGGNGGCDIWRIPCADGQYQDATNLRHLNTSGNDCAPIVTPDESVMFFNSNKPGGHGQVDLYVSLRQEDGSWGEPRNLGPRFNTAANESHGYISPDGRYFFFSRRSNSGSDIYWVDVSAVLPERGRRDEGPVANVTMGTHYDSIQCAVADARSGDRIIAEPGLYQESIQVAEKAVTVQSRDPDNWDTVAATIVRGNAADPVVTFDLEETSDSALMGFTITGGQLGVRCTAAAPLLAKCKIVNNAGAGIELSEQSHPTLTNCLIAANAGPGVEMLDKGGRMTRYNEPMIANCTIAQNAAPGLCGGKPTLANSILFDNGAGSTATQIQCDAATVTCCAVQGGYQGSGNLGDDPCFARLGCREVPDDAASTWLDGDYHLTSQAGRWDPATQTWAIDDVTSPCIDAGDPMNLLGHEPFPNGGRVNLGAYGGTTQASKSYFGGLPCDAAIPGDINGDGQVDWTDFDIMLLHWTADEKPSRP